MKKPEFKKMRRDLGTSRTLNVPIFESEFKKSCQRKRGRARNENLFEQIIKENFPSLVKEIHFQEVWEAQRAPKKLDPRRNIPRHIIITLPKMKEKERILKAKEKKEAVTYKGVPIRLSADSSKETLQAKRD
ncbi:hypothetical protein HJG60_010232 [Phyllostomus discolor]|uniref:L1 transposable element RRM domain-containing protein n=1 Tax=Phyllostomus discolor TaxID=89673 RepID=A0A834EJS3_9CHIR|nr:hypothetical protein HJG60_010232 [Phyllostomus discolor]